MVTAVDSDPIQVLFLSGDDGSLGRMAQGLLQDAYPKSIATHSACPEPAPPDAEVDAIMRELRIDVSTLETERLDRVPMGVADLIIVLTGGEPGDSPTVTDMGPELGGAADQLKVGAPVRLRWPVSDGTPGDRQAVLRRQRDALRKQVQTLVGQGYLDALGTQRTRMRNLAELSSEGVVGHDPTRRIYLFNSAAEKATGCRASDVLGRDCHEVFPPNGLCGARCAFRDPDSPELNRRFDVAFSTPDGDVRKLKITSTGVPGPDGADGDILAVIHDVTEVDDLRFQLGRQRSFHGMVGQSAAVREVFNTIRQVASSDYPVLITGESGTGKELAAAAIHAESHRTSGPFVPVNCGALPENILESELFGHVRGAFTGAIRAKKGRFELADRGTLFLDEVGELSPSFQVKLLRVLQEQRFERVGGESEIRVDVRIIAATNRDLRTMIAAGTFREDLFYRLCVVPLNLPALRDRREDFPMLVQHILENVREQTGKDIRGVSHEVLGCLLRHSWPGNIRELINALQFASVRCEGEELQLEHLPPDLRASGSDPLASALVNPTEATSSAARPAGGRRQKLNRELVTEALTVAGGNKVKAAKILGVGRATLYRFLKDNPVS